MTSGYRCDGCKVFMGREIPTTQLIYHNTERPALDLCKACTNRLMSFYSEEAKQ